jgi:hypothetical protein
MGFNRISDINFFEEGRPPSLPSLRSYPKGSSLSKLNQDLADPILRGENQERAQGFLARNSNLEPDYDDNGLICRIYRL